MTTRSDTKNPLEIDKIKPFTLREENYANRTNPENQSHRYLSN